MGLVEAVRELASRAHPGPDVSGFDREFGHRDEFGPPEYGDYIATSNDVHSVVSFRARHAGELRLRLYVGDEPDKITVGSGPVNDLLRNPNPFWSFGELMRITEMSKGLWGESFFAIEYGPSGPRELWWLKPTRVHPVPSATKYLEGFVYEPQNSGERLFFRPEEILWTRYPNPLDEFAGLSPLAAARLPADTGTAMMKSNRSLFTQGMQLGGLVMPTRDKVAFSAAQADELERQLERRLKGVDKAHRWAVLRFEAQVAGMQVTPRDAEFVSGLGMTFRQVCRPYGVPSTLLNDTEFMTDANIDGLEKAFWVHAMCPDMRLYADDFKRQLLPRFRAGPGRGRLPNHCEWDFSTVAALQESATSVWDRERQALDVGALTVNEWRARHGLPPVAWGDVAWMAANRFAVEGPESVPGAAAAQQPGGEGQ